MSVFSNLYRPVDNSQLVLFRILYGLFITLEAWGAIATGWVQRVLIDPKLNFPFIDFSFLQPLEGNGMIYYYLIMGFFGLMVMLGWRYRVGIIGYTIMWAGVYFMQKTSYNNHYYLMLLFNFIFCFMPAANYASLDSKRNSENKKLYCPQWCIFWFKAMILVVYFYSGVAKIYPGWLHAEPIKIWFGYKSSYPIIGPLLAQEWFQYTVAWGGLLFDLLIGPALLWKKTRKAAFIASIFFHMFNSIVFQVGVFPYIGMSFAVFFFEAKTIKRIFFKKKPEFDFKLVQISRQYKNVTILFISLFLLFQILLPLRHWTFKGDVNWTEEGHRLSWHMMLRVKGGYVNIYKENKETKMRQMVNLDDYLSSKQQRAIATRPDMMWQFVQHLKKEHYREFKTDVGIYAIGQVSLNGAPAKPLYDPDYNMAEADWNRFTENEWVLRQ